MWVVEVLLWLLLFSAFYSMFLYPMLMFVMSQVWRKKFKRAPIRPKVSLVIAAYNEEKSIAAKIENSLALNYPKDKLEVIVASDGSTDRTDEIVRGFAGRGVKLFRLEGNVGKSAMLNEAIQQAEGEIVAVSDATGMWSKDSVRLMAEHFADERVACVSGRVVYNYDRSATASGFGVYQRFVTGLRRAEAAFGAACNAPGSIHAFRKSAFIPSPPATFMDMVDPFHTAMQGYCTTYEDNATSLEESRTTIRDEFQARLRICVRSWTFTFYALSRFPILRSPMYCFQVISHKFLRYLIGPSLVVAFVANALLLEQHWIYQVMFAGQVLYWLMTLAAYLASRTGKRIPGLSGLLFFNSVNVAYLRALILYLTGKRVAHWTPIR